ncbi:uncharacterized protein [Nicotiana tomentosiformis]|uniref:uncharacterized protein n=1 Tax=Nicotiana tomentosiformis TaxID=4098 RepID=UPI00388CAA9B
MGLPHEDPQQHILNFLEISDTYVTNRVTPDYVRLTLFSFSLLGEAKRWLKAEPDNSITSWNDLARKVLARFFPSCKTAKIRNCPHHTQTNEVLAHTFIEGLHPETKVVVDAASGGQVLEKSFDEMYALLNKFSKRNPNWQGEMGRHTVQKSAGVLELDVVYALSAQVATLANQVTKMTLVINKQQAQLVQQVQIFCEVCGEGHTRNLCPTNPESIYFVGNANRGQANQYKNTYNPNWRNHLKFSWGGNQGVQNQYMPQVPQQKYRPPQADQSANSMGNIEEMLKKIMVDNQNQDTTIQNLKRQMGQVALAQNNRPAGALPSDTESNPKTQVNAVTLRNGRVLEEVPRKRSIRLALKEN